MKKIFMLLIIFLYACGKNNCEDCNSYSTSNYFISNNYGQTVILDFYFQNNIEQLTIENNTKILVYKTSRIAQEGKLKLEPYIYDSLQIYDSSKNEIYLFKKDTNCINISNGLCKKNYEFKNEFKDDMGNTYLNYELSVE